MGGIAACLIPSNQNWELETKLDTVGVNCSSSSEEIYQAVEGAMGCCCGARKLTSKLTATTGTSQSTKTG